MKGFPACKVVRVLFENLDDLAGADGTSTFADSELETFVHSNRSDEFDGDLDVVAGHNHLDTFRKHDLTGNIEGTDKELRTIVVVERSVTATFLFLEDVNLGLELGMRSDALRFSNNLTTFHILLVNTTQEETYVVASFTLREKFAEHLNTGNDSVARLIAEANELDRVVDVDGTGLDTTGNDSTTASDGEVKNLL